MVGINLALARRDKGMTQAQLAEASGVSQQLISQIERGVNGSTKHLQHLAKTLGVDIATIDPSFAPQIGFEESRAATTHEGPTRKSALITVFDVSASAGYGAIVDTHEEPSHTLAFPPDYLKKLTRSDPRHLAIIGVKGDSMAPTLNDDDIVMLDSSKTNLSYDGLFVLQFGDALHVKRVTRSAVPGNVTIISDNRAIYPPQEWPLDEIKVIGKVIWTGGKV